MTRQILWLSVASFCFCLPAYSQDYTYDGTLTQEDIDQSILYGSPDDISQMDEDKVYMDQIIVPNDYQATTGCLLVQQRTWNGDSGGQCANGIDGTYTFGYGQTVIAQTQDAIADALKVAGITVVGYRWQWRVKNADTNYEDTNGAQGQDPLIVTVTVKDKQGNVLDEREWDYSYHIDNWQQKYGMHWYDPFISGDKIDTITLEVEAYDAGYWAGYYGPEFGSASIYSILVVEPETQDCSDPLLDPTCPGYADALNAQQDEMIELIADVTSTDIIEQDDDVAFVEDQVAQGREYFDDDFFEETELEEETVEEEQYEAVVEEVALEEIQEEQSFGPSIDPLSVARNAVTGALADANSAITNTLENTSQSVADAVSINNDLQQTAIANLELAEEQSQMEASNMSSNVLSSSDTISSSGEVDEMSVLTDSISINSDTQTDAFGESVANIEIVVDMTTETFEIAALDMAINAAFNNIVQRDTQPQEKKQEQTTEEQNAQEDELVEQALGGDTSEEAQAALMGYNPEFRSYQQPQMPDGQFYKPEEIYEGQKNYDNPNSRFFNGASDNLHRQMVRSQYE